MDRSKIITCRKCGMPLKKGTRVCSYCQSRTGHIARAPKEKQEVSRRFFRIPWASVILILLNLAAAIYKLAGGETQILYKYGMLQGALQRGEYLRFFLSGFLHVDLVHLGCNMSSLLIYGFLFENRIPKWKYVLIYLLSLVGASLLINFIGGKGLHIGASGAIWGLMTANLIYCLATRRKFLYLIYAVVAVTGNVISTFSYGISWQGHFGGAITGILLGLCLFTKERNLARKS